MTDLLLAMYLIVMQPKPVDVLRECTDYPFTPILLKEVRAKDRITRTYGVRCTTA